MGYKKRIFLGNDSFKVVGWQSEFVVPKGDGIFGERKPFAWHEFSISDGHSCINLDEKESAVVLKQLVFFLTYIAKEEEKRKNLLKNSAKTKKAKK